VKVNSTDSSSSFGSVKFSVPMTVPDGENRTRDIFHLEADSLFDAKASTCQKSVQRPI
jgi:hypothetical protein